MAVALTFVPVPKALIALLTALVATAAVVLGMVLNRDADEPDDEPVAYTSTPLAAYETDGVALTRDSFCDGVPTEAAVEALGGEPESAMAYDNGERARLSDKVTDVAHEFGCTWLTTGVTARALGVRATGHHPLGPRARP